MSNVGIYGKNDWFFKMSSLTSSFIKSGILLLYSSYIVQLSFFASSKALLTYTSTSTILNEWVFSATQGCTQIGSMGLYWQRCGGSLYSTPWPICNAILSNLYKFFYFGIVNFAFSRSSRYVSTRKNGIDSSNHFWTSALRVPISFRVGSLRPTSSDVSMTIIHGSSKWRPNILKWFFKY